MRLLISTLSIVTALSLSCVPRVHAQTPEPAAAPVSEFTDLDQVIDQIPREALIDMRGSTKRDEGLQKASDALVEKVEGKDVVMKLKLEHYEKMRAPVRKKDGDAAAKPEKEEIKYRVLAEPERLKQGSTQFLSSVWINFEPSQSEKVTALRHGESIHVSGKVESARISRTSPPRLLLTIGEARLKD